ncbi:MAG: hypothetical protein WCK47_11380 [bacterium]
MRKLFLMSAIMLAAALTMQAAADAGAAPCSCARRGAGERHAGGRHCGTAELQAHYARVTDALCEAQQQACDAITRVASKWDRQTVPVGIARDRYFDPIYASYGPRAYAGSPNYAGPPYAASFERSGPSGTASDSYRGYYRHASGAPGVGARSGSLLSAGATHSRMQSGMAMNPGAAAPSAARVMNANR